MNLYKVGRSNTGIYFSYSKPMNLNEAEDFMKLMKKYFPKDIWEIVPADSTKEGGA